MFFKFLSFLLILTSSCVLAEQYPVAILGGGIGGLTAAIYLGRGGVDTALVEGEAPGGALTQSHRIQNWPGEISITGPELMDKVRAHASASGNTLFLPQKVVAVDLSKRPFQITTQKTLGTDSPHTFSADALIIAMGSSPKYLGIPGEKEYLNRGVYTCALCDGPLFKDKVVAVVGGGDSALTEAHYLANLAKQVIVLVRGPGLKGSEELRKKELLSLPNVIVKTHTSIVKIQGDNDRLSSLVLSQGESLTVDALFLAIGSTPNTQAFKGQLQLDEKGYIVTSDHKETSVKGVFAIGDITNNTCKQAVYAAGEAALSTLFVQRYLEEKSYEHSMQRILPTSLSTTDIVEIRSSEELRHFLNSGPERALIDFYAPWCAPCRSLAPELEKKAASLFGKVKFCKVNVDQCRELAARYKISAMPTAVLVDKKGNVLDKKVGAPEILKLTREL